LSDQGHNTEPMPGRDPRQWLVGIVAIVAAALGVSHYVSLREADRAMAKALTGGDPDRAPALLRRYGCSGCHTIPGLAGADGQVAPPLEGLRKRVYIAGRVQNSPENLIRWIVSPQALAPGSAMPQTGISESEARDVAAFLYNQ
jgi:cytochrome c2